MGCQNFYIIVMFYKRKLADIKSTSLSLPTILLESTSEREAVTDFSLIDELLDRELVKGSEFFLTNDFPEGVALTVPPNFHDPFAPVCFHSL